MQDLFVCALRYRASSATKTPLVTLLASCVYPPPAPGGYCGCATTLFSPYRPTVHTQPHESFWHKTSRGEGVSFQ